MPAEPVKKGWLPIVIIIAINAVGEGGKGGKGEADALISALERQRLMH